jgi:D-alanyl-D-alanine carboxypeptidase/D-alanyl-D-alanine-endopeptidase (penicillin-binding protein 4)
LVALSLVTVAVLAFGAAAAVEASETAAEPVGGPVPATPVLSARRVPGLIAAPVADRRLTAALDGLVARQSGTTCLTVSSSGRTVYTHGPDVALVPASIEKLFTAVAALEVLGPDHRLRTRVVAAAEPVAGVVAGDLWLVGGGDPLLATDSYLARFRRQPQIATDAEGLADAVVAAGVTRVAGAVVGDESRFDSTRYVDEWPARFIEQDQSGPISALTIDDNFATFPPSPEVPVPDETPAPDPPVQAASVLTGLLAQRGVTVAAPPSSGVAPTDAAELAVVESPPMSELVAQMLRESDNQTAEVLVKEIAVARGRPGTTADGVAEIAEVLGELGLPVAGSVVADGSGLAGSNRHTCELVRAVLDRGGPESPIGAGLPVAGTTGTLERRFVGTPLAGRLQAKTGTLNTVTALAGFLATDPGARVTFSFVVNLAPDDRVDDADLALQEELALLLLRYPEGPPLDALGPLPPPAAAPQPGLEVPGPSTTVTAPG